MKRSRYDQPLPEDAGAPGGVYLCQVSQGISCAACCGVYNDRALHAERLRRQLRERTRRFAGVRREVAAIDAFARSTVAREGRTLRYADFHSCPFAGLVGTNWSRVGCLLHPSAAGNRGVDYRGLSYYGGMACSGYFCPTHRRLSADIKKIVRCSAHDWYEYGLIITEAELLGACVETLRRRGVPVSAERFFRNPDNPRRLRSLLHLKFHWPYRSRRHAGICNYFFDDGRHPAPPVGYPPSFHGQSRHHAIFSALASRFESPAALQQAEALLDEHIEALAAGLR